MSQPHQTTPAASFSLPPSPIDLGGTLSSAFKIMRARLGQMVLLTLLPVATAMVLVAAAAVPLLIGVTRMVQTQRFSPMVLVAGLLMLLASLIASLMQVKAQGMMTLAAHDTIEQRPSTIGELWTRTRGLVGRVLALAVLVVCAVMLLYGLMVGLLVGAVFSAFKNTRNAENAVAGVLGVMLIVLIGAIVLGVLAVYLQTRLLYFVPVLAIEGTSAMDSLKRSWSLTRGNVLRTLGYYLIGSLIVSAVSTVASSVGQLFMMPGMGASSRSSSGDAALQQLMLMVPGLILVSVLQLAVMLLAVPFLMSFITVMFVDQVRRNEFPGGGRGAYGSAYAAPGQQPGWGQQPQQQFPQQGWGQPPNQQGWGHPPNQQGWQQPPNQPPSQGW